MVFKKITMSQFPESLLSGHHKFLNGLDLEKRQTYQTLATHGQKPETMVITCSDSRVAPETVFGCGPGELFVVRNVANLVPAYTSEDASVSVSAALEFAVQALRVKHVVVMGHGSCGGVKAALSSEFEPLSEHDFIGQWISMLAPLASDVRNRPDLNDDEKQRALEHLSIRNSIANLQMFPWLQSLCDRGALELHGAWFDIANGDLWTMDRETGEFKIQSGV